MDIQEFRLAILHKVISELRDAGKTRIQKIGYFIQEAVGIPTKYPFRMHHYGPYSESLETDVARLELTGYIDVKQDHLGSGYHITPTDEPLEDWVRLIAPHEQQIGTVLRTFGRRPTHELELAATIHFVKGLFPNVSTGEILRRVKALKPRFDGTHIRESYDELEQLGLIEAENDEDPPSSRGFFCYLGKGIQLHQTLQSAFTLRGFSLENRLSTSPFTLLAKWVSTAKNCSHLLLQQTRWAGTSIVGWPNPPL